MPIPMSKKCAPKLSANCQVVVPADVRESFDPPLEPGDRVVIEVHGRLDPDDPD